MIGTTRRVAGWLAVLGVLGACGGPQATFTATWLGPDGEPSERGRDYRDYTYEVRADVGPDHCDWQSVVFLRVGWPLGRTVGVSLGSTEGDSRTYVRDADGVLASWPGSAGLDLDAVLPEQVEPTGYRTGDVELWFGPDGGDRYAYLRSPDGVERWPRDTEGIACA